MSDSNIRGQLDWSCREASVPWNEVFPEMDFLYSSSGWTAALGCFQT